ncbi:MAG: DUF2760 domain-containing protein [Desulfobacteraceae bacterium]|nr:DUF2760 domain-containing protein [Desulfobacteraceae bacterium]
MISIFMLVVSAGLGAGFYHGLTRVGEALGAESTKIWLDSLPMMVVLIQDHFFVWILPALAGTMLILGWILWLILGVCTAAVLKAPQVSETHKTPPGQGKNDFLDQKMEQERRQRLFLHTLSVLQREGRLLDFFDEDLGRYEDAQIGAAVRSIQEDCKRAMKKYIDPRPVVDADEGQPITIAPGFDMDAITLVGDVAGDPPFEGIIKHRGWKAGKKEVPKLSDIQDPAIITPAEIQIGVRR